MATKRKENQYPIRARSHLLKLLGDELIGDDRLAIFELVKNGYDADATEVGIELGIATQQKRIVVHDNGSGMRLADITDKWLELATASRRDDRRARTPRFRRQSLGEKGVGRIATFKLGRYVKVTTRAKGHPEQEINVDWDELVGQGDYLEDLNVTVLPNANPKIFKGSSTGTRIEITGLRHLDWSRGEIRRLYRFVTSLASPFKTPDRFTVKLSVPGREKELSDMIGPEDFLDQAVWKFDFQVAKRGFNWNYEFAPPHWQGINPRKEAKQHDTLQLVAADDTDRMADGKVDERVVLQPDHLKGIGSITGQIYAYFRRPEVLSASGSSTQLKNWLDDQTGVRVYRDGVRVFTYGEPQDDWLGLNVRRINRPGGKVATNTVVAAIHLGLEDSTELREKTNREGFDQNAAFARLRRISTSVFEHFEDVHAEDRRSLDKVIKGTTEEKPIRFNEAISNLRTGLHKKELDKVFKKDLDAIAEEFGQLRDVMVNAGTAGLNLAVIFHEIEREVDALASAVERGLDSVTVREQIDHLYQLLHGFAPLLRKNPSRLVFASEIVQGALRIRDSRFKFHKVTNSAPILQQEERDFRIKGPSNLLIGSLGNLIDNSLYWARFRKERDKRSAPGSVLITTNSDRRTDSGFIAVVDNGPGFLIPAERAIEAFNSTRRGGMGLGLFFANQVMEQCGGSLTIHSAADLRDEIAIPRAFDGAAVVMRFRKST
jgi:signal transduction histidine kinase